MEPGSAKRSVFVGAEDAFESACWVCGAVGRFRRRRTALSETYRCPACNASLRYQGQARAIVRSYARHGSRTIAELVDEPEFRELNILEPAGARVLRRYFRRVAGYVRTVYDPAAKPGEVRDDERYEDLMQLTFASESIDLVVTSDVFEHVRHPDRAFAEVFRVLRSGGMHIFSIPVRWPMRPRTIPRVDVTGADDVPLLRPVFHHSENNVVYNDFGADLLELLDEIGFVTDPMLFASSVEVTSHHVTFCSTRPAPRIEPVQQLPLDNGEVLPEIDLRAGPAA